MQAWLGTIVCKFDRDPAVCAREEAIFATKGKCLYHVNFDLTFTLSTSWMQCRLGTIVCKFGGDRAICLVEEVICAKRLQTDRQTDRQTDGQTDRRRTRHDRISSFLGTAVFHHPNIV